MELCYVKVKMPYTAFLKLYRKTTGASQFIIQLFQDFLDAKITRFSGSWHLAYCYELVKVSVWYVWRVFKHVDMSKLRTDKKTMLTFSSVCVNMLKLRDKKQPKSWLILI